MRLWILYRGNELDNAQNFGIFSSEAKAEKALKMFEEFEDDLHIESFIIDELEKLYPKVKEKTRRYGLYSHRVLVHNLDLQTDWQVTPPNLDSFIHYDEIQNFMYRNEWAIYATIYAESEKEAIEFANKMLEKLGDEEDIYA